MNYTITKVNVLPEWEQIPVLRIDKILWCDDTGIRAYGQVCYDDENLYVHMSTTEKDIRAENTAPLSPVHEDSCLEFFFRTGISDNYFNFEINPNGCMCLQYGPSRGKRFNIVKHDAFSYFDIQTGRTSEGWELFYKIPLEFIRLFQSDFHFEGSLFANMYKCGDKTVKMHFLAWAPIDLERPDFHRPEYFKELRFE